MFSVLLGVAFLFAFVILAVDALLTSLTSPPDKPARITLYALWINSGILKS